MCCVLLKGNTQFADLINFRSGSFQDCKEKAEFLFPTSFNCSSLNLNVF